MNVNQIRHLVSAHEGANLLSAEVSEVAHDYVEVACHAPSPPIAYAAEAAPFRCMSFKTRCIPLVNSFAVCQVAVKAAYDYQTHTIYFRRVR